MSQEARQQLASDKDQKAEAAKRKMTSAIIEDEGKKKDAYEFLEDDDDFEEFEIDNEDDGSAMVIDSHFNDEADRKLW